MYNKENYRRWYDIHKNDPEFKKKQKHHAQIFKEKYIKKYGIESWRKRNCDIQRKFRNGPNFDIKKHRDTVKKWRDMLALEVFIHYGGDPPKCACCGESHILFLTIDHINNDGAEQRKKIYKRKVRYGAGKRFYSWLKKQGYPEGYQVLCYNCNCGKQRNKGVCPHLG